ncbi:N(4)-(beta-N-acetylglucosaminyl)-L-asparaginase [Isosphaeraceae bacterium EP7]
MKPSFHRRNFLAASAASVATLAVGASPAKPLGQKRPLVISGSLAVVELAMKRVMEGADPLDAAIEGVAIHEADPNDHSVGYGGTPNEEGVVELDAAVMHGPTHGAGAVAALRNIMHPAAVARVVMQRTKHCLIVGDNALKFAREHGFPETKLETEVTREAWIHWKENLLRGGGARLGTKLSQLSPDARELAQTYIHGTVHCSVMDTHGDLGCTTSTSGLGYKVPGRVGDSPILGAGLYLDNTVGSCGSVGLGEVNLINCSCYLVIENMRRGMHVKDAMIATLKRIAETATRDPRFRNDDGKPNFDVTFYGLSKDGKFSAANLRGPTSLAVHDGKTARNVDAASLED